uniref:(northern house mosquito) hypothetical protein n=2 Tax=Culex pipiens TaxID=7175 RepID=A0A8D8G0L6_CULPI
MLGFPHSTLGEIYCTHSYTATNSHERPVFREVFSHFFFFAQHTLQQHHASENSLKFNQQQIERALYVMNFWLHVHKLFFSKCSNLFAVRRFASFFSISIVSILVGSSASVFVCCVKDKHIQINTRKDCVIFHSRKTTARRFFLLPFPRSSLLFRFSQRTHKKHFARVCVCVGRNVAQ